MPLCPLLAVFCARDSVSASSSSIVPHDMRLGSLGACGVGRLPHCRYSLCVRAVSSHVPSVISTSLGSPQILICGESGGRSCFVDLAERYRPSQSPCRTRNPARDAFNADIAFVPCVFMCSSSFVYVSASYAVFSIALAVKIFPFFYQNHSFPRFFLHLSEKKAVPLQPKSSQ